MSRPLGTIAEDQAAAHLERAGYRIVARNVTVRGGELDLVALDGATLVFVEVRSRSGDGAGTPLESVDARKQARVARVARHFLAARAALAERDARFDVVGVRFDREPPAIEHVCGAFEVAG